MKERTTGDNEVIQCLNDLGYKTNYASDLQNIDLWLDWYQGLDEDFHIYNVWTGKSNVQMQRKSLQMPKRICEDKADLLMNEKCEIKIDEEMYQTILDEVLEKNNFMVESSNLIEITQALGTGAFNVYKNVVDDDGDYVIEIDYINATMIFPLKWKNGIIIDCAFASKTTIDGKEVIYLNIHTKQLDKTYLIENIYLCKGKDGYKEVEVEGIERVYTNDVKLFNILMPNKKNNYNLDSPFGISAFGNCLDVIQGLDIKYDSYVNEFILGKKRIFCKDNMFTATIDGNQMSCIDKNDVVFHTIDAEAKDDIYEVDFNLRTTEHKDAIQDSLNLLSVKCGFGTNYYEFNRGAVKTATEVISENSQLYKSLRKDELLLEKAIKGLVKSIIYLSTDTVIDESIISINFDDSIIQDDDSIRNKLQMEYSMELIDKVQYFIETRNMTEEQAIDFVNQMEKRKDSSPKYIDDIVDIE